MMSIIETYGEDLTKRNYVTNNQQDATVVINRVTGAIEAKTTKTVVNKVKNSKDRSAEFICNIVYFDGEKEILEMR